MIFSLGGDCGFTVERLSAAGKGVARAIGAVIPVQDCSCSCMHFECGRGLFAVTTLKNTYSGRLMPDPPISFGMSLNFGLPPPMGSPDS